MKTVPATANITGYVNVTANDLDALKTAMAFNGPISIAIDASHRSLSFYSHGVYYEPDCSKYSARFCLYSFSNIRCFTTLIL